MATEDQPARRPRAKRHRPTQHEQAQQQRAARGPERTRQDRPHSNRLRPKRGIACCAFAVCWARRRRAARREGWEPVTATVVDSSGGYQLLRLDFSGGAHLAARTVAALRGRYSFLRTRPVEGWVSGAGRAFVLVLPYGPSGPLPYAIPLRVSRGSRRTAGR